jgi:hypothetical protein
MERKTQGILFAFLLIVGALVSAYLMPLWLFAICFLILVGALCVLLAIKEGWRRAAWQFLKTILTGW